MEAQALASPSFSKLFTTNPNTNTNRPFPSSIALQFFGSQKFCNTNNNVSFSSTLSLQFNPVEPISYSCLSTQLQADLGTGEAVTEVTGESNTAHVRFQLQKECLFGQQFLIVGSDPNLGMWDPAQAIPLDWSEGHVWTVDLDIPIGKTIQFKFILKGDLMDVVWQPGPDRILQTWETNNTITVVEDWENAEVQKLTEEPKADPIDDMMDDPEEEPSENKDSIVTEKITSPVETPDVEIYKQMITAENKTNSEEEALANAELEPMVLGNVLGSNGAVVIQKQPASENKQNLVDYEGEPILVPGLTPSPVMTSEEVLSEEIKTIGVDNASNGANGSNGDNKIEHVNGLEGTSHIVEEQEGPEHQTTKGNVDGNDIQLTDVIVKDMQWGRNTMQKLLEMLGIPLQADGFN